MQHQNQRSDFITIFLEKNKELNLSSIRDEQGVYEKHILDSLTIVQTNIIAPGMIVADIGTGGGFPLLPLAMSYPQTHFVGVESIKKKCIAIEEMAKKINLKNVTTQRTRAENLKEKYDIITARAVSYISNILKRTSHLIKPKGYLILYKLASTEEKKDLLQEIKKTDLHLIQEIPYTLPSSPEIHRVLYVLQRK